MNDNKYTCVDFFCLRTPLKLAEGLMAFLIIPLSFYVIFKAIKDLFVPPPSWDDALTAEVKAISLRMRAEQAQELLETKGQAACDAYLQEEAEMDAIEAELEEEERIARQAAD